MAVKSNTNARGLRRFFQSEKAGGILLIACTVLSLALANSAAGDAWRHLWHLPLPLAAGPVDIPLSVEGWINDLAMAVFFLLAGLEIRHELSHGELSSAPKAILPALAALGGMLVPAAIHYGFNHGGAGQPGIGVPMATDIAFSLGVLSLLGDRVPVAVRIFLTALAIIDDLGAVLVIALFYSGNLSAAWLAGAAVVFALLLLLKRSGTRSAWPFVAGGLILWYCMFRSGIHATLSGVLLAFALPSKRRATDSPAHRWQHGLHFPVNLAIVPLFALANTAIALAPGWLHSLATPNSLGIGLGLLLGKPIGILLFTWIPAHLRLGILPNGLDRRNLIGLGVLAGIGFTMSIFISNLAFGQSPAMIESSKMAVLVASALAALGGAMLLGTSWKKKIIRRP